jgi:hypothetical protein
VSREIPSTGADKGPLSFDGFDPSTSSTLRQAQDRQAQRRQAQDSEAQDIRRSARSGQASPEPQLRCGPGDDRDRWERI